MKRYGAVVVFKNGIARETAELALEEIGFLLDAAACSPQPDPRKGFQVEEYDDSYGGPVWYIP